MVFPPLDPLRCFPKDKAGGEALFWFLIIEIPADPSAPSTCNFLSTAPPTVLEVEVPTET